MKSEIRIGTRKSDLSIAQTMLVADAIRAACPGAEPVLVGHSTLGDKILDKPLVAFGGKGVFVTEFEEALLRGEIDLAVHSAKDLPADLAEGLDILGALPRGDVRDVLVTMADGPADPLCIGTSSLRRQIQIEELKDVLWPGREVVCENLRGNVLTRLDKLESGRYDGIILAAAGLDRLDIRRLREGRYRYRYFSPVEMIPAGGQGILAIEGIRGGPMEPFVEKISDRLAMAQLQAERQVLKRLGTGCHEPVGVYCRANVRPGVSTAAVPGPVSDFQSGIQPSAAPGPGSGFQSGIRPSAVPGSGADFQSGTPPVAAPGPGADSQAGRGEAICQLLLTGIYEKDGVRRRAKVQAAVPWGERRQAEADRLLAETADRLADELLGKRP